MMAAVTGLRRRDGIVTKRRVPPTTIVFAANSASVSVTPAGTIGLFASLSFLKSPASNVACGSDVLRKRTGLASQRRSYAAKKKVFFFVHGAAPLKLPPVSFRLK